MKIYTKTGDKGSTGLFGGQRVQKSSVRLHAYGGLDELNACIGVVLAKKDLPADLQSQLIEVQKHLFVLGSDLATPNDTKTNIYRVETIFAAKMEKWIDAMTDALPPLTSFILPGGSDVAAELHHARTVCRRAERWIVELRDKEPINENIIIIVNRLSDYLFTAARYANKMLGVNDVTVEIPRK